METWICILSLDKKKNLHETCVQSSEDQLKALESVAASLLNALLEEHIVVIDFGFR